MLVHCHQPSRVRCADHFLFAGFNNWGHTFGGHFWLVSSVSSEFFGCLLIHRKAGSRPSQVGSAVRTIFYSLASITGVTHLGATAGLLYFKRSQIAFLRMSES